MYILDCSYYDKRLSEATDSSERKNALACRWESVKAAVAHSDVFGGAGGAFGRSLERWWKSSSAWKFPSFLEVDDCRSDLTAESQTEYFSPLIHILGDLDATVTVSGSCEIVIAGSIRPGAGIRGDGFVHVFVGGNVEGYIHNKSTSFLWIDGDLRGEVLTGTPSTEIHVMGNCEGVIKPLSGTSLLFLDVGGFMSRDSLEAVASCKYTTFSATIGASDQQEGISYPSLGYFHRGAIGSSFQRWVVHAYGEGPGSDPT